eukprot:GDKJ01046171.1.p1 GENE.GDKJ01046171.1~~GDKJ01046171.1.p1  ORF type:complete len:530 (+),score=18.64 GDKJ01046171.1:38-1627(+)
MFEEYNLASTHSDQSSQRSTGIDYDDEEDPFKGAVDKVRRLLIQAGSCSKTTILATTLIQPGLVVSIFNMIYTYILGIAGWVPMGSPTFGHFITTKLDVNAPVNYLRAVAFTFPILSASAIPIELPPSSICFIDGRKNLIVNKISDTRYKIDIEEAEVLQTNRFTSQVLVGAAAPSVILGIISSVAIKTLPVPSVNELHIDLNNPMMNELMMIFEHEDVKTVAWTLGLSLDDSRHLGKLLVIHNKLGSVGKTTFLQRLGIIFGERCRAFRDFLSLGTQDLSDEELLLIEDSVRVVVIDELNFSKGVDVMRLKRYTSGSSLTLSCGLVIRMNMVIVTTTNELYRPTAEIGFDPCDTFFARRVVVVKTKDASLSGRGSTFRPSGLDQLHLLCSMSAVYLSEPSMPATAESFFRTMLGEFFETRSRTITFVDGSPTDLDLHLFHGALLVLSGGSTNKLKKLISAAMVFSRKLLQVDAETGILFMKGLMLSDIMCVVDPKRYDLVLPTNNSLPDIVEVSNNLSSVVGCVIGRD